MWKAFAITALTIFSPRAHAEDFATQMLQATFKIYHQDSTATGVLVRAPAGVAMEPHQALLVTAGHVFERMKGEEAILTLRTAKPDGTFARRDVSFKVRSGKQSLWAKHPGQDVAVMRITLPEDAVVQPIDFAQWADEAALVASKVHLGSDLLVLGFPLRVESSEGGFPIARHASVAGYPLTPVKPNKTFMADFSTFSGDSGGPVFVADPAEKAKGDDARPLVLGIVLAQHFGDEKLEMYYEERTVHHPLNVATILHAQFVREVIEQLKKPAKPADAGK